MGSHSCHVKQVMQGTQRDETMRDSTVNINPCDQIECEVHSIKAPTCLIAQGPLLPYSKGKKSTLNTRHLRVTYGKSTFGERDSFPGLVSNIALLFGFHGDHSLVTRIG